ncbi:MAG: TPM domain-containing protein [Clostridia bacterium]|nr:TPM domain-containing protein [Clostridia bacterium]
MKRIIAFLLVLLLIPCLAGAEKLTQTNEETGYIAVMDDSASLLDPAEYSDVMSAMMGITDYCNVGLYTYDGESRAYVGDKAEEWANRTFPGHCTMFVIDMTTRQLMIASSDDVKKTITQSKGNIIVDNIYVYASDKQYARCAETAFNQMLRVLNGGKVTGPMKYISNALLALVVALLLAYLFISARHEQEVKVSLPEIITATAGVGAAIGAKKLSRKVHHSSSSGGGSHGGGFSGGGGGGFHVSGSSHGF